MPFSSVRPPQNQIVLSPVDSSAAACFSDFPIRTSALRKAMPSRIHGPHHGTINLAVRAWVEGVAGMRPSLNIVEAAATDTLTSRGSEKGGTWLY